MVTFSQKFIREDITTTGCRLAAEEVRSTSAERSLEAYVITIYNTSWNGVFVLDQGAFVELHSVNMRFPELAIASGHLQMIAIHILEEGMSKSSTTSPICRKD